MPPIKMTQEEFDKLMHDSGRAPTPKKKKNGTKQTKLTEEDYKNRKSRKNSALLREAEMQNMILNIEGTGAPRTRDIYNKEHGIKNLYGNGLTSSEILKIKNFDIGTQSLGIQKALYEKELAKEKAKNAKIAGEKLKREAIQDERSRFGRNYQAKDYVSNVTSWTATSIYKRPYSRNGLRNEWMGAGPVSKSTGLPILDNRWRTITEARGTLNIGKPISKGSLTAPSFFDLATSFGKGNPIMPRVRKIRGRKLI